MYLIEIIPLLKRLGGPLLLSSLQFEGSLFRMAKRVTTDSLGGLQCVCSEFCDFFVISDFSLAEQGGGEPCLDEPELLMRIFFTALFEVDVKMEFKEITGPRAPPLFYES